MPGRLQDKVVLVAGAGSVGPGWGNGKAAAVLFAREGAKVFAVDINGAAALETTEIIRGEGGTCDAQAADVTQADQVESMVQACLSRFRRIDILQNNVGGSAPGGPVEMSEEEWDAQIDFNLKGAFLTCKYVLPVMEKQGRGVIVNVASVSGIRYLGRTMAAYYAAKAGLIQFTRVALGGRCWVVWRMIRCTLSGVRAGLRPGRGASFSMPLMPAWRNRLRQRAASCRETDNRAAICLFCQSSAASKIILARKARRTATRRPRA